MAQPSLASMMNGVGPAFEFAIDGGVHEAMCLDHTVLPRTQQLNAQDAITVSIDRACPDPTAPRLYDEFTPDSIHIIPVVNVKDFGYAIRYLSIPATAGGLQG